MEPYDPARRYNDLLEGDPSGAAEQAAWLADAFTRAGIAFDGAPMRSFLRPHLLRRSDWESLREAARRVLDLAARVARRAFGGDAVRLCAWLGTPEAEVPWTALDPGEPDVLLSRLDGFLTPGGPRFIEINSDAPAGFGYGDRMVEVFRALPVFQAFAREADVRALPSVPALVEALVGRWRARGGTGPPRTAICDWADVKTRADQEILRDAFESRGVPCVLADPREVEVAGGRVVAAGRPVDLVYRRALLPELLERAVEVRPFLQAYRDSRAAFVNSFRCRLSEDKAFLALLTDEAFAHLLSAGERAVVARWLPWTRKLEERRTIKDGRELDLVPFVVAERPRLVLKPAHGYGGQSVLVGDETEPAAWEAAVQAGLGRAWVVQERVRAPEEPFPVFESGSLAFQALKVNVNPFYVGGAEAGAVTRASRSSVINVSAGGGSVPTFVVG